MHNMCLYR